eukprot:26521-Chlamydomonas_euryale.AAC.2
MGQRGGPSTQECLHAHAELRPGNAPDTSSAQRMGATAAVAVLRAPWPQRRRKKMVAGTEPLQNAAGVTV